MVDLTKPAFISLTISLFLVLGGVQLFDAGVLGDFIDLSRSENNDPYTYSDDETDITGVSSDLNQSLPSSEQSFIQDPVGSTLSLFDSLGIVKDFILLLFNVVLAPIEIFTSAQMPTVVKGLIGVPLTFFNVMGIISFIRSGA